MAAGILLVQEAGGYVTEIGGGKNMLESGSVLATNDRLYPAVAGLLREAYTAAGELTYLFSVLIYATPLPEPGL